jgi:hypothetical protein
VAWSEHGFVRRNDLCARVDQGTLFAHEVPELADGLKRGRFRRVQLLGAAVAASTMAAALARGEPAQGIAALVLLAVAQAMLSVAHEAPRQPFSTLPLELDRLSTHERRRLASALSRNLVKASGLLALAGVAAVPGTAISLALASVGLGCIAVGRRLR